MLKIPKAFTLLVGNATAVDLAKNILGCPTHQDVGKMTNLDAYWG